MREHCESEHIRPRAAAPIASRTRPLLLAFAVFCLSLIPRLWQIGYRLPEPDELHWIDRSYRVIERLRAGELSVGTTHLGHPGLPPALAMAAGEVVAESWNDRTHAVRGDGVFVDRLTAARMANAVLSSLLPAAIILVLGSVTGSGIALLMGCLVAFDPRFIGLGRIAHIDCALALFTFLSALTFFLAEERRSLSLKLLAGVWWGFAFMTKPTAVALIPAFIVFKLIVWRDDRSRAPIDWGDVGAVLIAHLLFAAVYTRLWPHESDYLVRLHIQSRAADLLYTAVTGIRSIPLFFYSLCAGLAATAIAAYRIARPRAARGGRSAAAGHLAKGVLLAAGLALAALLFPAVCENIIRFWSWVFGLSSVAHHAYGKTLPAPPGGYPMLFLTRVPSLMVVMLALGMCVTVVSGGRTLRRLPPEWTRLVLFCLIVTLIWTGLLSVSSKQTFRYILPTIPFLYLTGTILSLGGVISRPRIFVGAAAVLIAGQIAASVRIAPFYEFYFNDLTGGLRGAAARGNLTPLGGAEDLMDGLYRRAKEEGRRYGLGVIGDYEALLLGYRHRYNDLKGDTISVIPEHEAYNSDYVIALGWRRAEALARGEIRPDSMRSERTFAIEGVVVAELFEYALPDYLTPLPLMPRLFHRMTGTLEQTPPADVERMGTEQLRLESGTHKKGFAMTGVSIRFKPGTFRISVSARLIDPPAGDPSSPADDAGVVKLMLGKECEKLVRVSGFAADGPSTLELDCSFTAVKRPQFSVYWFGKRSVVLGTTTVVALPPS